MAIVVLMVSIATVTAIVAESADKADLPPVRFDTARKLADRGLALATVAVGQSFCGSNCTSNRACAEGGGGCTACAASDGDRKYFKCAKNTTWCKTLCSGDGDCGPRSGHCHKCRRGMCGSEKSLCGKTCNSEADCKGHVDCHFCDSGRCGQAPTRPPSGFCRSGSCSPDNRNPLACGRECVCRLANGAHRCVDSGGGCGATCDNDHPCQSKICSWCQPNAGTFGRSSTCVMNEPPPLV
jgi:hypothetical protein